MTQDKQHSRAFGLVVWFSLWVREVPSSILGMPPSFYCYLLSMDGLIGKSCKEKCQNMRDSLVFCTGTASMFCLPGLFYSIYEIFSTPTPPPKISESQLTRKHEKHAIWQYQETRDTKWTSHEKKAVACIMTVVLSSDRSDSTSRVRQS